MKKKAKVGTKNAKPITKTETVESFFNFFDPPEIPQDSLNIDQEAVRKRIYKISFLSMNVKY
jgi:nucleosome assembly protein 1-like 1